MNKNNFFTGLIIGAAVGAIAAIATAPQAGNQLRTNLKGNTNNFKEQISQVKLETTNVKNSVSTLTNELKNNMPNIINELKQSISAFKTEIDPTSKKLQQEIGNLQKTINEIEQNISNIKKTKEKEPTES